MKIAINKKFDLRAKQKLRATILALGTLGLTGCDLLEQNSPDESFKDTIEPVFTITGGTQEIIVGQDFVEPTVTAEDDQDGDVTADIVTSSNVDSSTAGSYTISYSVSDKAGNEATATYNVTVAPDSDGDGVADNKDAFPTDIAASVDTDGDGYPDSWNEGKTAADSTTPLTLDAFPNDASENTDTDGDGVGDNADAFPNDPTKWEPEVEVVIADVIDNISDAALRTCLDDRIATGGENGAYTLVSELTDLDCSGSKNGNFGKIVLDINDPGIKTLAGLNHFSALTSVKFSYNSQLADISQLADMDLRVLKLDITAVDDAALEIIANHTNLRSLNLNGAYLIKDGVRASEVFATLTKMEELFLWNVGSDAYNSEGNDRKFAILKDGKITDLSFVGNMPLLKVFNAGGQVYEQGIEGFNSTPLINNLNLNWVGWKASADLTPLMNFDKAGLNVMFLQGGPTTAVCEKIFDVVQHYAPDGVDARVKGNYQGGGSNDMLLAPPATNRFIRLDAACLNTLP